MTVDSNYSRHAELMLNWSAPLNTRKVLEIKYPRQTVWDDLVELGLITPAGRRTPIGQLLAIMVAASTWNSMAKFGPYPKALDLARRHNFISCLTEQVGDHLTKWTNQIAPATIYKALIAGERFE